MAERRRLPDRRATEKIEFSLDGVRYVASLGFYGDHRRGDDLAEVFLYSGKPASGTDILSRDAALILSIALQHGVPATAFRDAMNRSPTGRAVGPIGYLLDVVCGSPENPIAENPAMPGIERLIDLGLS